jgi:glycogen operon protein
MQWNDRFRDEIRGFVRAEPGLVGSVMQRVQGSPDLFGGEMDASVNFVTAHDGLTLHDLTIVTSDHHHSWDCGDQLRMQQLKNYFTMLLLSRGAAMFVMGDEFARTQGGNPNPFDVDGPITWVEWTRLQTWHELRDHVRLLLQLRRAHPPRNIRFYGLHGSPDTSAEARSLAWSAEGLYVVANVHWEPAPFVLQEPGPWELVTSTAPLLAEGTVLPPRAIAIYRSAIVTSPTDG